MPLLNYTTTVSADKSVGEIRKALVKIGCNAIMEEYLDESLSALSFRITYNGQMISFRLPARVDKVYEQLIAERVQPRYRTMDQAANVAWRIIKDWVEAQVAIIQTQQAETLQVFLPYAQDAGTGETLYEKLASTNFQQLLTHSKG